MRRPIDRRDFLLHSAGLLGAAALSADARAASIRAERRTRHVVLVAFAGGVRSRETVLTPDNIPNLMRLAQGGVVCPDVAAENVGHYGAALSIFTGRTEVFGIRENARSPNPTVFEYLRRQLGLPANEVWLSTSGGNQQVNYAHGTHPKYGPRYGANLISPDGVFNADFRSIVEQFGRPRVPDENEERVASRLRALLAHDESGRGDGEALARAEENRRRIERFILEEIAGKTVDLTGPGAADAKAIRIATNILRVFRPTLLGIALNQHDLAHRSYNGYVEIVRRNDQEFGRLIDAIEADEELRDSTAVVVLPEFGRDRDLNERNGLDHGDGSEDLLRVAMIARGPEVRRGRTVRGRMRTIDVCPTICSWFGVRPEYAQGRVMRGILA